MNARGPLREAQPRDLPQRWPKPSALGTQDRGAVSSMAPAVEVLDATRRHDGRVEQASGDWDLGQLGAYLNNLRVGPILGSRAFTQRIHLTR